MITEKDIEECAQRLKEEEINKDETWAIYGTGEGAELVYTSLQKNSIADAVKVIIEKDEKVNLFENFHGILVKKLSEVCDYIDGIIIGAIYSHEIILERIRQNLTKTQMRHIYILDVFGDKVRKEQLEYLKYLEKGILKENDDFVPFNEEGYETNEKDTKIIAWYLPQFHQIDINNIFHGQGFTEWSNTSRAIPMFVGHYQPHIPYDVGYYDLLNPDTLKRQIYLAKHYGIYGFCFHYYWFSGTKLMEKPLELFLEHKEMNMPFCLDWATENWTALWDGGERQIMVEQKHKVEDDQKFMKEILPYLKDYRYIKIEGKPVLIIYRISLFSKERAKELLSNFRDIAKNEGFPDLYIMLTNAIEFKDNAQEWGADALVEFPPHGIWDYMRKYNVSGYLNPYFIGEILDAQSLMENKKYLIEHREQTYFRSALTSWDCTARKATTGGCIFHGFNPKTFKQWLTDIISESKEIHSKKDDIVFVNSWNEWAEGSHLEPDMKYGYAYLQVVKEVLEEQRRYKV